MRLTGLTPHLCLHRIAGCASALVCLLWIVSAPVLAQEPLAESAQTEALPAALFLPGIHTTADDAPAATSNPPSVAAASPTAESQATPRMWLPVVYHLGAPVYRPVATIPIEGLPTDRPAASNGDVNLALRGYSTTTATRTLIDIGGPTDDDPPQLATLFSPARVPTLSAVYRVHDWNWSCGDGGCRGDPIASPAVTLVALSTSLGEALYLPERGAEIYGGGYKALVLYADERRITLKYTREDSPVWGYMIHLEEIGVDPSLLQQYRQMDAAGRTHLPALKNGDLVGYAIAPTVKVAVRDTGMFMDPRTRKDWWKGW